MSKESYIRGFCKVAEARGHNPDDLARLALSSKLQKQAFLGALSKAVKGVSKAAPIARRVLKPVAAAGRAIAQDVTKPREILSAIKNPTTWTVAEVAPVGYLAANRLRNTRIGQRLSNFFSQVGKPASPNTATPRVK